MKTKFLILFFAVFLSGVAFATPSSNLYVVPKTVYTTAAATVVFPFEPNNIEFVNYESSNVLLVQYQTSTFEVDPAIASSRAFADCNFKTFFVRAKTGTVSAEILATY